MLGGYRGVVMCDGYVVYSSLHKQNPAISLASCWAHARRKYVEVEEIEPGRCTEVLDLIGKLFEVEARAREGDLDRDALLALRQAESKPIVDAIHAWALEQRVLPKSPLGKAIAYMGSLWDGLTVFLENSDVPVDNNGTERALRGVAIGRKKPTDLAPSAARKSLRSSTASSRPASSLEPIPTTTCATQPTRRSRASLCRCPATAITPAPPERRSLSLPRKRLPSADGARRGDTEHNAGPDTD